MSDTKSGDDKTLTVSTKKPLSLKRPGVEQGTVRQNFSHGRTKQVVVETKKRKFNAPGDIKSDGKPEVAAKPAQPAAAPQQRPAQTVAPAQPAALRPSQPAPQPAAAPRPAVQPAAAQPLPAASVQPEAPAAVQPSPAVVQPVAAAPAQEAPVAPVVAEPVARATPPAPPAAPVEAQSPAPIASVPVQPVVAESRPAPRPAQPAATPVQPSVARPASAPSPQASTARPGAPGTARPSSGPGGRPAPASNPGAPSSPGFRPRPHVAQQRSAPAEQSRPPRQRSERGGMVLNSLSASELEARRRALAGSHVREQEDRVRAADEARRRAEDDERRRREREESARRQAEEEARIQKEAEDRRRAEEDAKRRAPKMELVNSADDEADGEGSARRPAPRLGAGAAAARRPVARPDASRTPARPKSDDDRRRGKLTVSAATDESDARGRSLSAMRRRQEKFKRAMFEQPREKIVREVTIPETITIQELAGRMAERAVDIVKYFMKQGQIMKPGDVIDADTAELVAGEFGHTVRRVAESDIEEGLFDIADRPEDMESRPPVVTIMGHVDHGKTSLLDAIRNANVVSGEAGGITQHIGAYQVEKNGSKITFIDTPGHAAFTAMRARGAQATDIAILVVAADDSVMPQTIESISHAKAAKVPIIVAINKVDKPSAQPQKIRSDLLRHEVFVESMGGETLDVEVSAKTGAGLDKLLEAILLQAEVLDLKANPERTAEGVVIEAKLDKGRGSVATVLVQTGTLLPGDILVAGNEWGRVRALIDDQGEVLDEALPSTPVEILGLSGTPRAGDRFAVVNDEARAREITEYRQRLARDKAVARQSGQRGSLEQMMSQLQNSGLKEFPLVIKADVAGSVEAIVAALDKLGTDEVRARIVHSGAGAITETDVSLAETSGAAMIGFNVRANAQARQAAEQAGLEIRYYNIIYNLVDDVKQAMSGLLSPERRETFLGNAEILQVFDITKVGKIAGCRVTEGRVERGAGVRLIRDNVVIHEGTLKTLKRFKDEVGEVPVGQECGMAFQNYEDIREGDVIECFRVEMVARSL